MVQEKYGVRLATQEKGRLRKMIRAGRSSAQAITRARILIKIDEGWTAPQVATALDVSERTVFRTKRRYAEEGLDEVLRHHNQVNRPRKVDERATLAVNSGQGGGVGIGGVFISRAVRLRLSSRGSRNNGALSVLWTLPTPPWQLGPLPSV